MELANKMFDDGKTNNAKALVAVAYQLVGGEITRVAKEIPLVEVMVKEDDKKDPARAMTPVTTMGLVVAAAAALF